MNAPNTVTANAPRHRPATARPNRLEPLEERRLMSASYHVVDLGVADEYTGNVGLDINNDGVVINSGGVYLPGKKGKYGYVPLNPAGTKNPSANAVNNTGQIVGDTFFPAAGDVNAALYTYSKTAKGYAALNLGNNGEEGSNAKGVNDAGQVVGTLITDGMGSHAYLSSVKKGKVTYVDLQALLPGNAGFELRSAEAINNAGQILVKAGDPGSSTNTRTFLVRMTKKGMNYVELPTLDKSKPGVSGYAINESGVIVGSSSKPGFNAFQGVVWRQTKKGVSKTELGTLGGKKSRAFDVNEKGVIVGFSDTKYGPDEGVVWTLNKKGKYAMTNLNDAGDNAGLFIKYARGVNDKGWIVAEAVDANYDLHTVVLVPKGAAATKESVEAAAVAGPVQAPTVATMPFATTRIAGVEEGREDVLLA
jgi:uncharacterized membrane protein